MARVIGGEVKDGETLPSNGCAKELVAGFLRTFRNLLKKSTFSIRIGAFRSSLSNVADRVAWVGEIWPSFVSKAC